MAFIRCITHTILSFCLLYMLAKASCLTEKLVSSSLVSQNYCFYSISISLSLFPFFFCSMHSTNWLPVTTHHDFTRSHHFSPFVFLYSKNNKLLYFRDRRRKGVFCFFFVRFLPCSEQ